MGALGIPQLLFQGLSNYIFNILKLISKDEGMEKQAQSQAPYWLAFQIRVGVGVRTSWESR